MLEGLVAWVLNNYLGRYVENLNTHQLSIALLSGEVELENLPLRKDALRHLGVPIEIRAGFIGRIRLQIPITQLRSAPWIIAIERLYVVAGPAKLDDGRERLAEYERKLGALDHLEACWRRENEANQTSANYYQSSYTSWLSYGTSVITDIVENLQLRIKDVHIRYEDSDCHIGDYGLACGVHVSSLSAQTCDEQWRPQFTRREDDASTHQQYSFKTVDLDGFSVYCDKVPITSLLSETSAMTSMIELANAMDQLGGINSIHNYLVAPVSGYAHVTRNCSEKPLRSTMTPRLVCELALDEVPICLNDWQYEAVISASHTLTKVNEDRFRIKIKPQCSISENPKLWWIYVVRCIRPRAWSGRWTDLLTALKYAKESVEYVKAYERALLQPSGAPSVSDRKLREQIEWERDIEQLWTFREAAMRRVPHTPPQQQETPTQEPTVLAHWFPQWWWGGKGPITTPQQQEIEQDLTKNNQIIEGQIIEALNEAVTDTTMLKRDTVFGKFNFTLKRGVLSLQSNEKSMLELKFESFCLGIESRPRSGLHKVELGLGALSLRDLMTPDTLFPILIGAPQDPRLKPQTTTSLFHLECEIGTGIKKLKVRSQPLDVVYNAEATKWLIEFLFGPQRRAAVKLEAARTKRRLIKNWESMVEGRKEVISLQGAGNPWQLYLDISAPQIILTEKLCDKEANVAIIDLGRLHVTNQRNLNLNLNSSSNSSSQIVEMASDLDKKLNDDDDDEDTFVTPCSTPPGSEASGSGSTITMQTAVTENTNTILPETPKSALNEGSFHERLYERYEFELSDMQVLACRAKDVWRHAHSRGTSAAHVLERFTISARCERRLIRTSDPMYPSLTLCASLPRLIAHVNEPKVNSMRAVLAALIPETNSPDNPLDERENENLKSDIEDEKIDEKVQNADSLLVMVQLGVEHVSLQVQSRGRSVAELQVSGASATYSRRPFDTAVTLTVHGLLLVDALQTHGPDYELLIASHRHVAMDSISGSLRDSEPTSPTSPASPDPSIPRRATSPVALTKALNGLVSPQPLIGEALICIEYTSIEGPTTEPLRIANIQFNNLDVIANQETISELIGFAKRVFPHKMKREEPLTTQFPETPLVKTELTFDFHRLNVLLMRGDDCAKKVATATMSGARIQATVDGTNEFDLHGSLGGLQVLDLTEEGRMHRRAISVGRDPLGEPPLNALYILTEPQETGNEALAIDLKRLNKDSATEIKVRMASVWYTHSPKLLAELQSCVAEFQQYLANIARTIKAAAVDMVAIGLAQGSSVQNSPSRRRRSSLSLNQWRSTDEIDETPSNTKLNLKLDVVLDSPVVVLPRSAESTQVLVAHLGRITLDNTAVDENTVVINEDEPQGELKSNGEFYKIQVKDMNLYSLETSPRRRPSSFIPRAETLYSCENLAEPLLHDTALKLHISRKNFNAQAVSAENDNPPDVLLEEDEFLQHNFGNDNDNENKNLRVNTVELLDISGSVVGALKISLSRAQYDQLLDTFRYITNADFYRNKNSNEDTIHINNEDIGIGTLQMDPHVRARMFRGIPRRLVTQKSKVTPVVSKQFRLGFDLPLFAIELKQGNTAKVELQLRDFSLNCERNKTHETNILVSLRSLHMDDLEQPYDGPIRHMAVSSSSANDEEHYHHHHHVSRSCPDLASHLSRTRGMRNLAFVGSLPDHLEPGRPKKKNVQKRTCDNNSPPPKQSHGDNLVLISCLMVDPTLLSERDFALKYNSVQRATQVDLNSLDLIVRPETWNLVLDFFSNDAQTQSSDETDTPDSVVSDKKRVSELCVTVRSLTVTLAKKNGSRLAKASVRGVKVNKIVDESTGVSETEGRLGRMTIADLTEHGVFYRERFQTLGEQALHVTHKFTPSNEESSNPEAILRFEMATVLYVHTKRFISEIQSFFSRFGTSKAKEVDLAPENKEIRRTLLEVQAGAPIILLPVSSRSSEILVADLGRLNVSNVFVTRQNRIFDVMSVELLEMDLYAAERLEMGVPEENCLSLGDGAYVKRSGKSLLNEKCRLLVTVERCLSEKPSILTSKNENEPPSLSIKGDLSTLEGTLELAHYRLIKGLLAHNLGEPIDEILLPTESTSQRQTPVSELEIRSTLTLLQLGLQNVTVHLNLDGGEPLASIYFIRSKLTIENFSDGAQDIDLLSQEIVVLDTRINAGNAFTDILGPAAHSVEEGTGTGLEVHSRRRPDYGEFTVLLNNMRVMVLPAWWVAAREYIFVPPPEGPQNIPIQPNTQKKDSDNTETETQQVPYELKINVTNSELVAVEDASRLDTTAVTLRSTTVLNWRPGGREGEKPLTCSLNHCELFTCVLGREQETALSILDPVTVGVELSGQGGALEITIQQNLNIRLSYHDVIMLAGMLKSLKEQANSANPNNTVVTSNDNDNVRRLVGLGFSENDCIEALNHCKDDLEEAALWLTRHAIVNQQETNDSKRCRCVILTATCLVLTFIDDCGDSDVPLLELCLSDLTADQSLITTEDGGGTLQCKLSCDYYNRTLSGWEPCIEPWQCEIFWRESSGHRFLMDIRSDTLLDLNVTSALIELYKLVGESWRRDILEVEKRPRRRFIPFALKNETGVKIGFVTSLSTRPDDENVDLSELDENQDEIDWKWVGSGETVPFEYPGGRRRQRHGDTHRARMHSLKIRVAGWKKYARVSIDRVGVYFRDVANRESGNNVNPNKIRIVFDVRLDGQARKLVTVRSALVLTNKLPVDLDVSLGPSYECKIHSSETWSAPLEHSHQKLRIRPLNSNYGYCQPEIDWRGESKIRHEMRLCRAGTRTNPYYFSVLIRTDLWPPDNVLPSHTITLLPSVLIVNLLPHDLHFTLRRLPVGTQSPTSPKSQLNCEGVVTPGNESAVNTICAEDENENDTTELELKLRLEGFKCCAGVRLTSINDANYNIRLEDAQSRRLTLRVAIIRRSESAALKITISAPFWIINRTGLPLIFRQEGVSSDAAGQFQENELARMVAPLLFSWTDTDASPSVICRVGHAVSTGGQPLWCQNFHLRRGIQVRRLTVTHTNSLSNDGVTGTKTLRPDTVYVVGIEVRPGRGRYRCTSIVTISPRYQLHNRTGKTLIFSQQCHASGVEVRSTHVRAVPGCQVPFHWPRPDRDLLLCVSCELNGNPNNNFSLWSGGLLIDKSRSLHVTIRDNNVSPIKFLRLEVVARGASLHAIFVEANDNLPPPLRIDNKSEVTITFAQRDCIHECVARAGTQIPYAWDEPDSKQRVLLVSAPGGATASCNMERLGPVAQLTYENFIYVAFVGTFTDSFEDESLGPITNCDDRLEYQKLVLDVPDDGGRVFIARKQPGRRSQLWRMTSTGQLQHVGSPADRTLVLDIEGPAPQPAKGDSRLALRRPDPRRRSTQTWRFTADGRLCCAHENMCVQPRDSIWGLRPGGLAVLAPNTNQPSHREKNVIITSSQSKNEIESTPIEQRVGKQRMRPGSGFLSVEVTNDGPTKVLCIRDDIAERNKPQTSELEDTSGEFRIVIRLTEGLGLSLVGRGPPQELIYACFINVVAEITKGKDSRQLNLSVGDIQCDNQLFGADSEVIVYTPTRIKSGDPDRQGPALSVSSEIQMPPTNSSTGVHIFRHLVVKINALVITIEEQLLLRLAEFFGIGSVSKDNPQDQEATDDLEEAKPGAMGVTTSTSTKYYFGVLSLSLGPVRLSVRTAKVAKLPDRLKNLRKYLGLTPLVQFEDAALAIEPYAKRHLLDTWLGTWRAVYTHFREELLWQAAVILGNVDFLGAPFGLMSDVSEGVSGLINERSVGALVMNVTHGLSNSAAKVTDALGDGLGRVLIMDEAHEETRQRIRKVTGSGHLVAGIKGFGFGLIDGATGLFRHVYEGATQDGVQGALSGVGKGLVGIVAKPVVGVLDLASEAARAVRDSSRGASRTAPGRKREPRVAALGSGGLLPRYGTGREARGQSHLHKICSGSAQPEKFVAYGPLRCSEVDDLRFIVSTERVRVVTNSSGTNSLLTVVTEVRLEDIVDCLPVDELPGPKYYVELLVKGSNEPTLLRRPRIRCDTEQVAKWASRQVNFARRLRNEKRHTLHSPDEGDDSILM